MLALLFRDDRSAAARSHFRKPGVHVVSSLAWVEVHGVIARAERERALADVLGEAAREALENGPWLRVNTSPEWSLARELSERWPLRGADLWHLAAAKTLAADLPGLTLLTFDARLASAAREEGLGRR